MTATATRTAAEREIKELIATSADPMKMIEFFIKIMDKNSIAYKFVQLMSNSNYKRFPEFAAAANMTEEEAFNIICLGTEPTLDEVITFAKVLNREPEEIAQIFIDQQAK